MRRKLKPSDLALWAALPMAHTPHLEGRLKMILDNTRSRRVLTRQVLTAMLGLGAVALVPLAMLQPAVRGQAAVREQAAPWKADTGTMPQSLLVPYYGVAWLQAHPEAAIKAAQFKPRKEAALYGEWALHLFMHEAKSQQLLEKAQALEPGNPQWPDQLGHLYQMQEIHASPEAARRWAQKALAQYEMAAHLLGDGQGTAAPMAITAFDAGEFEKARRYAEDLLKRDSEAAEGNGSDAHYAHLVLGRLALHDGDVAQAEAHLLAMGRVSGSPTLDTFGPNMQLAKDLLDRGDRQPVLAYFDECAKFWKFDQGKMLNTWQAQVKKGITPNFGGNLYY